MCLATSSSLPVSTLQVHYLEEPYNSFESCNYKNDFIMWRTEYKQVWKGRTGGDEAKKYASWLLVHFQDAGKNLKYISKIWVSGIVATSNMIGIRSCQYNEGGKFR